MAIAIGSVPSQRKSNMLFMLWLMPEQMKGFFYHLSEWTSSQLTSNLGPLLCSYSFKHKHKLFWFNKTYEWHLKFWWLRCEASSVFKTQDLVVGPTKPFHWFKSNLRHCVCRTRKWSPSCLSRRAILHPALQPLCGSLALSLWAYCRDIRPRWHKSWRRQQFLLTQHRAEMDGAAWVCRTHPQSRAEKSLGFLAGEPFFFKPLQYSQKTLQQRCNTFEACIKTPVAIGRSRLCSSLK